MTEYLKLDSARVSFAEYWRWKPNVAFLLLAIRKVLRSRFSPTVLVPAIAALDVVDPSGQLPELVAALAEPIKACEGRQRTLAFWYTVPTVGGNVGLAAALSSADGRSVAMAVVAQTIEGTHQDVVLGLASRLRTGGFLTTGPGKSLFDPPPEVESLRLPGRPYSEQIAAHDELLRNRKAEVIPSGDVRELILELQQLQVQANVARGVYVAASEQDVARMTQIARGRRTRG